MPEYWKESWILKEICSHYSGRPSVNTAVKNSESSISNNNDNNTNGSSNPDQT